MKKLYNTFKAFFLLVILLAAATGCEFQETDFGLNGSIKGVIKDSQGDIVYSNVLTNTIVVNLLGEGDQQPIQIRVKGDGTYENTKIYPKRNKIWVTGPVVFNDTIYNDFSDVVHLEKDFVLTPFISPEVISANVNGTSVTVQYAIAANAGKTVARSEVYCSTAQYPTSTIGSRPPFYSTKTVAISGLSGTIEISGLTSGERYFIRIGSLADGTSLMNYSNQAEVTIQ